MTNHVGNVLIPNYNVGFYITAKLNHKMSNIYLGDRLFAGVDVTKDYWDEHREDLYKNIDPELSGEFMWEKNITAYDTKTIIFPITSRHV